MGWTLALALLFSANNVTTAQCTMICNDLVQISLDQDCEVELLPDMILEGYSVEREFSGSGISGGWTPASGTSWPPPRISTSPLRFV